MPAHRRRLRSESTDWPPGIWRLQVAASGFVRATDRLGPGYRVYYGMNRQGLCVLLCGGDKRKQSADIERRWNTSKITKKGREPHETQKPASRTTRPSFDGSGRTRILPPSTSKRHWKMKTSPAFCSLLAPRRSSPGHRQSRQGAGIERESLYRALSVHATPACPR